MTGFITIPRQILEDPLWKCAKAKHKAIYLTLVQYAAFKAQNYQIRGHAIRLERGQVCMSWRAIAEETGPDVSKEEVKYALKYFSKTFKIATQQTLHRKSVITLLFYDGCDSKTNRHNPALNPATLQRHSIKEESKNEKKQSYGKTAEQFRPKIRLHPIKFNRNLAAFEGITAEDHKLWQDTYPGVDTALELKKMRLWLLGPKGLRRKGNRAFVQNWLGNASPAASIPQESHTKRIRDAKQKEQNDK